MQQQVVPITGITYFCHVWLILWDIPIHDNGWQEAAGKLAGLCAVIIAINSNNRKKERKKHSLGFCFLPRQASRASRQYNIKLATAVRRIN